MQAPYSTLKSKQVKYIAQRGGRNPVPGDIQGQARWGSEQSYLAVGVPVHCREDGPDDL